jgi:hypothetical protein
MNKKWLWRGLLASTTVLLVGKAYTNSSGPPAFHTGAPGDHGTCAVSGCHNSFPLNSGTGSVQITGLPASYNPGETYNLVVTVARTGQVRGGFQLTAKKADGTRSGNLPNITGTGTKYAPESPSGITQPQYRVHTSARSGASVNWNVQWVAPAAGAGAATFYVAGNSANGDGDSTGDRIYSNSYTVPEAVAQVCKGDLNGDRSVDVSDAILVLQDAVGIPLPPAVRPAADVNSDTEVNVADAVVILQVAVDLNTSIPKTCQ